MPTHYHTQSWDNHGPNAVSGTVAITAEGEIVMDVPVAVADSPVTISCPVTAAQLKALFISANKAVTLVTNGDPADTITVPAGGARQWNEDDGSDCPIQEDMTTFTATVASDALVQIRILQDATP